VKIAQIRQERTRGMVSPVLIAAPPPPAPAPRCFGRDNLDKRFEGRTASQAAATGRGETCRLAQPARIPLGERRRIASRYPAV